VADISAAFDAEVIHFVIALILGGAGCKRQDHQANHYQ
jgi:hypothetical protein